MKRATFIGHVAENGALSFDFPKTVKEYLLSLAGAEVDVQIGKHYKKRTEQENRYYYGVIIPIVAEEIGEEDKDIVHSWLQIAVDHKKTIGGHDVPLGTSELSTVEFEDYASRARMFASKFLNVYIPLPNEGIRDLRK
jgi:hypothetical protein